MKRSSLRQRVTLRARTPSRRATPLRPTLSLAATDALRAAVVGRPCIAGDATHAIDPRTPDPTSLGGCGEPLRVVPSCRTCHRAEDRGELDLLPCRGPASC